MKILVFGAGVLGSSLTHSLVRGGNDITVLARGKRAEQLKKDGLVIRHYFQRKTTVDHVRVIESLQSDVIYDLIFVVMKYNDFPSVLPILANNHSTNIVLVGNNADAHSMQKVLMESSVVPKNIVFGFQLSGGIRENNGRIVCIRAGMQMVIGSLDGDIPFKPLLEGAFKNVKYKLSFNEDMDGWLKSHFVTIVALNSLLYLNDGDFHKASNNKMQLMQAISVMDEGFQVLEKLGYTVTPASQVKFIRKQRKMVYYALKILHKLPFMKLVDGSFAEIMAIYDTFGHLKHKSNVPTPNWDVFEKLSTSKYKSEK